MEHTLEYLIRFSATPFFSVFTASLAGIAGAGLTLFITGRRSRIQERKLKEASTKLILLEVENNLYEIKVLRDALIGYLTERGKALG
ncbi:MAG: hypothetical protein WBG32_13695, partial [Nodosilinea sp.]